jgi:ubiquinone/menaquinone biosynthesis C-methylase UbiE
MCLFFWNKKRNSYEEGWNSYSDRWETSVKQSEMLHLGDEWGSKALTNEIINAYVKPYLASESIVLEIGCGGGKYSEILASLCKELTCSDVSMKMLNRTKKRLRGKKNVEFEKLNGFDLRQFKDCSIDFVFSFDTFVHIDIEDIYSYLQEINRVLRKHGKGVLHFANLNSPEGWQKFVAEVPLNKGNNKNFDRFRFLTWEIVERLICSLNFDILDNKKEPWRDILVVLEKKNGNS